MLGRARKSCAAVVQTETAKGLKEPGEREFSLGVESVCFFGDPKWWTS